jgi:twitching motility protein PilT
MQVEQLLRRVLDKGASDLHIRVPSPPVLRIQSELITQDDLPPVTADEAEQIFLAITTPQEVETFRQKKELDLSYTLPGSARFRVNVLQQRGTLSIAFRMIPLKVPSIDELSLPPILKELVLKPRGLILVTGHTGSGKSTTLAAMVNHLNDNDKRNIIIIEEPVEFIHHNRKCIIAQRDVGSDTESFSSALIRALRHDPDVLVVGEMRDLPTISTAITAAETGHLVLATLHTNNAPQSIDRIIDVFPPDQQQQIRFQLSQVLEAVLSQTLLSRISGGMVAAFEIMIANQAVRNLIRESKVYQLPGIIQLGTKDGMLSLDQSLADLVSAGLVARESALFHTTDAEEFEKLLKVRAGEPNNNNRPISADLSGQAVPENGFRQSPNS